MRGDGVLRLAAWAGNLEGVPSEGTRKKKQENKIGMRLFAALRAARSGLMIWKARGRPGRPTPARGRARARIPGFCTEVQSTVFGHFSSRSPRRLPRLDRLRVLGDR